MVKITVGIEGMACGMREAHINGELFVSRVAVYGIGGIGDMSMNAYTKW